MAAAQTVASTVGAWALGVVVVFLIATASFRAAFVAGDFIHDLSEEVQALFGRIVFATFACALVYLMFWGCYLVGDYMLTHAASYLK